MLLQSIFYYPCNSILVAVFAEPVFAGFSFNVFGRQSLGIGGADRHFMQKVISRI